jgi:hypothetical protein
MFLVQPIFPVIEFGSYLAFCSLVSNSSGSGRKITQFNLICPSVLFSQDNKGDEVHKEIKHIMISFNAADDQILDKVRIFADMMWWKIKFHFAKFDFIQLSKFHTSFSAGGRPMHHTQRPVTMPTPRYSSADDLQHCPPVLRAPPTNVPVSRLSAHPSTKLEPQHP